MRISLFKKGLVIGMILSFICMSITPSYAVDNVKKSSKLIFNGNTLYVGGMGPGNYTRIQDAIDNSTDGDTIFVCNGTYYENVIINKSINLFGEDKNNTIIDGKRTDDTLWIMASFINVSSFTILNSSTEDWNVGILVIEKEWWEPDDPPFLTNINISDCVIKNNRGGIRLYSNHDVNVSNCIIQNNPSTSIYVVSSNHITINECIIIGNGEIYEGGIAIREDDEIGNCSNNVTISNCSISYNFCVGISVSYGSQDIEINHNNIFKNTNLGILISGDSNAKIFKNHIYNNGAGEFLDGGILIQDCNYNVLVNNVIKTNNKYGLFLLRSMNNKVVENNFIGNIYCNAFFLQFSLFNHWSSNYWTDWIGLGPKLIKGKLGDRYIPWVNFDWHPAKEPYDI